jgi:hypothetical protein
MRNQFNDMIMSGIANRKYQTFIPSTTETDPVVRTYNNCYGLFNDTHMSKMGEGEYVITGSLCRVPEKFDGFLYSINYGLNTAFRVNGKVMSLACFLSSNGLTGYYDTLNGDSVYKIVQNPGPVKLADGEICKDYNVCAMDSTCGYPVQLGEKMTEILATFVDNAETIDDVRKQMNESEYINGNDWNAFKTSNGICVNSDSDGRAVLLVEK